MSRNKHAHVGLKATLTLAQQRVGAVLACLKVLCPSAAPHRRRYLAKKFLASVSCEDSLVAQRMITPAVLYEMITRNSQCVLNHTGRCPLLVFSQQLSEELNEFFRED
jgi:hypothetical protein